MSRPSFFEIDVRHGAALITGRCEVQGDVLTVSAGDRRKSAQLGSFSHEALARMLLLELVRR